MDNGGSSWGEIVEEVFVRKNVHRHVRESLDGARALGAICQTHAEEQALVRMVVAIELARPTVKKVTPCDQAWGIPRRRLDSIKTLTPGDARLFLKSPMGGLFLDQLRERVDEEVCARALQFLKRLRDGEEPPRGELAVLRFLLLWFRSEGAALKFRESRERALTMAEAGLATLARLLCGSPRYADLAVIQGAVRRVLGLVSEDEDSEDGAEPLKKRIGEAEKYVRQTFQVDLRNHRPARPDGT